MVIDPPRDEMLDLVLRAASSSHPAIHTPTRAELDVIRCLSHGLDENATTRVLGIPVNDFRARVLNAQRKLAAKNDAHAVARALRHGLIA